MKQMPASHGESLAGTLKQKNGVFSGKAGLTGVGIRLADG